ncbi:MAG: hypothetical protein HY738_11515 [Bacteroidia bacterium]|nr:hypothetical protein [Bacteroidia bacterium]
MKNQNEKISIAELKKITGGVNSKSLFNTNIPSNVVEKATGICIGGCKIDCKNGCPAGCSAESTFCAK